MELAKEIELLILTKIAQKGQVTDKDFDQVFTDNNFVYNLAVGRTINASLARLSEINHWGNAKDKSHYQVSELGELRRRDLEKEKNDERAADLIHARLTKHTTIVRAGTKFLLLISVVTLLAALYLIHKESNDRHIHNSVFSVMQVK